MIIHSLTTESYTRKQTAVTTLHADEAAVIESLRENYDDGGEYADVPDDELVQTLIDRDGLVIYIEQHDITYLVPLSRALSQTYEDYLSDEPDQHGLPDMLTREQYDALKALA